MQICTFSKASSDFEYSKVIKSLRVTVHLVIFWVSTVAMQTDAESREVLRFLHDNKQTNRICSPNDPRMAPIHVPIQRMEPSAGANIKKFY